MSTAPAISERRLKVLAAESAIWNYTRGVPDLPATAGPPDEVVHLIVGLFTWCDERGLLFDALLDEAREVFLEEVEAEAAHDAAQKAIGKVTHGMQRKLQSAPGPSRDMEVHRGGSD